MAKEWNIKSSKYELGGDKEKQSWPRFRIDKKVLS